MHKLCILIIGVLLISSSCYAQAPKSTDTIFYMVDTLKTPLNDRMIASEIAGDFNFYTIKCPCLKEGVYPVFRCNVKKYTKLGADDLSHIKFIKLSQLIQIVSTNDDKNFNDRFVIWFIEPHNYNTFIKRRVFFQGGFKTTSD